MRIAMKVVAALSVILVAACGSVPELQFADASSDASASDAPAESSTDASTPPGDAADDVNGPDASAPDAGCALRGADCKKGRDCCSMNCQSSGGGLKVCAP